VARMPRNRGKNITLIAALTSTSFTADFTFEGGLNVLALEAAGHRILSLPRYSPDLNPIEEASLLARCVLGTRGGSRKSKRFCDLGVREHGMLWMKELRV
jgi:hypothetical protein